jgi:hypothetical protein
MAADPSISADGRLVAFQTWIPRETRHGLIAADSRILVWDRTTHETRRADLSSSQRPANWGPATGARISANGRFVVFSSEASNLVPGDHNRGGDVFVRDLVARTTTRASIRPSGTAVPRCRRDVDVDEDLIFYWPCGNWAAISATGRFVAFWSASHNFDRSGKNGIYFRDMRRRRTIAVAHGDVMSEGLSDDGRVVAYGNRGHLYVRAPTR